MILQKIFLILLFFKRLHFKTFVFFLLQVISSSFRPLFPPTPTPIISSFFLIDFSFSLFFHLPTSELPLFLSLLSFFLSLMLILFFPSTFKSISFFILFLSYFLNFLQLFLSLFFIRLFFSLFF